MRQRWVLALLALGAGLSVCGPAVAQSGVEMRTTPAPAPHFEIAPQGSATREATRPRENDFYREDVRVRQEPAFIEPFVKQFENGDELGLAGWTTPQVPVGSLSSQAYQQNNGWFSLGLTFIWNSAPRVTTRPATAPR